MTDDIQEILSLFETIDRTLKKGLSLVNCREKIAPTAELLKGHLSDELIAKWKAAMPSFLALKQYLPPDGKRRVTSRKTLPITLIPPSGRDFKAGLLKAKCAYIIIYYNDGRSEVKEWNAANFKLSSNVIGNLRSRAEFRQGVWQETGIAKVEVSVKNPQEQSGKNNKQMKD